MHIQSAKLLAVNFGQKIAHHYYLPNEYIEFKDGKWITEDKHELPSDYFTNMDANWTRGWFVYNNDKILSSDFRIGNLVCSDKGIGVIAELFLYDNKIGIKTDEFSNFVYSMADIFPIVSNEEWLYKLGFENYEGSIGIKVDNGIFLRYGIDKKKIKLCIDFAPIFDIYVPYVHQVQNLFYSITKKELTLKNKQ